jgi:hypothetical protein
LRVVRIQLASSRRAINAPTQKAKGIDQKT